MGFAEASYVNEIELLRGTTIDKVGWIANEEVTAIGVDYTKDGTRWRLVFCEQEGRLVVLENEPMGLTKSRNALMRSIKEHKKEVAIVEIKHNDEVCFKNINGKNLFSVDITFLRDTFGLTHEYFNYYIGEYSVKGSFKLTWVRILTGVARYESTKSA